MLAIEVLGDEQAIRVLDGIQQAVRLAGGMTIAVGSDLPYAYGIEFGHFRSGRLARRAGGAQMIAHGLEAIAGQADGWLAEGLERGPAGVQRAQQRIGSAWVSAAQGFTPRVSGRLAASERYVLGGG